MKLSIREIVLILIIVCLAFDWVNAVINQQNAVAHVSKLYNHLVGQCNITIGAYEKTNFCITLPNNEVLCDQNDLNAFYPFG